MFYVRTAIVWSQSVNRGATKAARLVRIVDFIERATSACRLSSLCRVSAIACSSVGVPNLLGEGRVAFG
jgi:hypothetical protein